jgi:adenosylcobyric acid synthase
MTALMLQGTASGVGKSLLVAGLCRLLARGGVRVAPFKPQNMSNNAAACPSGGEIGRAQALQAFACGLDPHPDMNPVLIKPESDCRAQLIVHGRPRGTLRAARFREDREALLPAVLESFARLRAQYDVVIVEGAGSAAEPNLRAGDIANMGFAQAADVPVWLVGDIDRGGVFASLLGSLALLDDRDRARVEGLVINRFRGDPSLLDGALDWLAARAGVPVLGRVPYVEGLELPEEDAPYRRIVQRPSHGEAAIPSRVLQVVAVFYPTASNTTDLDALDVDPGVALRLVRSPDEIEGADLVVLPGSKAVLADLAWLRDRGFVPALGRHLRYGGKVLGLCGGMQMLGEAVEDPHGLEGGGCTAGLGWLPIRTRLEREKHVATVRATARWPEPVELDGYEIHHGRTIPAGDRFPFHAVSEDGRVWGTYVHGLFDRAAYRHAVLAAWFGAARADTDMAERHRLDLDRLADAMRSALDLAALERRIGAYPRPS